MIPYFPPLTLQIGAVSIHGFGIAMALALVLGYYLVGRQAHSGDLDESRATLLFLACVATGLTTGYIVSGWHGQSAWGVIAGAVVALLSFLVRNGKESIRYFDVMAFTFPWVWAVARFGCFLAHDHIGARSSHWLAVAFPGGGRFDLGALECMAALLAGGMLVVCRKYSPIPGVAAGAMLAAGLIARSAIRMLAAG